METTILQALVAGTVASGQAITKNTSVSIMLVVMIVAAAITVTKIASDVENDINNLKTDMVEIKAQSGQQHGGKHPRSNGWYSFDPQFEEDLKSWLFIEKISSRNGKPMKPKVFESEEKGADILVAMTDFFTTIDEIESQVSYLCPKNIFIDKIHIDIKGGQLLKAHFYQVELPLNKKLNRLKEIWLYDECHLDKFLVLFEGSTLLLDHLKRKR